MRSSTAYEALVGAAAGLFGGFVMNGFQRAWTRRQLGIERSHGAQSIRVRGPLSLALQQQDAPMRIAGACYERLGLPHERTDLERGGHFVHLTFSSVVGALYGCVTAPWPAMSAGGGAAFGTVLWAVAELGAVPALGLSRPPQRYPAWVWIYGLTSHWVFGIAVEQVRKPLRSVLYVNLSKERQDR